MVESIAHFFTNGGPFMWLLLILLASATAIVVERLHFYLVVCRNDSDQLVANAVRAINDGTPESARTLVETKRAPLNVILRTALDEYRAGASFKEVRQSVEEVAIREVPRLTCRLNYLAMLANVATLAGLLGTIFGLQRSFSSLAIVEASEKAALLASGISQAMNTTAFGLFVAIPCLIAFTKLTNIQAGLSGDLDASSVRFLNFLEQRMENPVTDSKPTRIDQLVSTKG